MTFLLDTNVLISAALFPDGKVSKVVSHILESHDVILCSFSIEEAFLVFQRKFPNKIEALERYLRETAHFVFQTPETFELNDYPAIRDKNDLPILVSAIQSGADMLLTGDKDFQDIKSDKPLIFTPGQYLDLIERSDK